GDHDHVGFGSDGKPFFWLGNGGTASHGVHVAFACASRAQVDAFHAAAPGDHDHVGFGSDGKPFFWLGNGGTASHGVHVAF
ncbi:hypothetical protein C7E12_21835, partial [Stenotrophomonas maltophilia]